jgi:hypothetical protein
LEIAGIFLIILKENRNNIKINGKNR